jgi:type IV secretion system protein VirD4
MATGQHSKKDPALSWNDILGLFKSAYNPERRMTRLLYIIGALITPFSAIGALIGYVRAYNRHMRDKGLPPNIVQLQPIVRLAMVLGGIIVPVLFYSSISLIVNLITHYSTYSHVKLMAYLLVLAFNIGLTFIAFALFNRWRNNIYASLAEEDRFGTARWATKQEMADLVDVPGIYIGNDRYYFKEQGHLITIAGPRSGKNTDLIAPNILNKGDHNFCSWFIIDPKKENACISANYRAGMGRTLLLDPWNLQSTPETMACYNPLDLISGDNPETLADDATVIADMIVVSNPHTNTDPFWSDRAKSLITGLIIYIVLSQKEEHRTLAQLWRFLHLSQEKWTELLAEMSISENEIVKSVAEETVNLMINSERTYASIISTAQNQVDFLKSPALQRSLSKSTFDMNTLTDGNTVLYCIIPADKLQSHARWLRLLVTTALRSVVRNKNKRVVFLLDEFSSLGFLPEVRTALSNYAGYNVTMWIILQSLMQLKKNYGDDWETFMGEITVKHFFGLGDNFTASYLSSLMGQKSYVTSETGKNGRVFHNTARPLATPDELRRGSANNIFMLIGQRPPTYFQKKPFYEMPDLAGRADDNPYYKGESAQDLRPPKGSQDMLG